MKYASVCSGVEAASLAWGYLGWEPAWFSEIEPFPCAVLKERFPHVPNLGDMTKIKVENLKNGDQRFTDGNGTVVDVPGGVDLLVGGTPCQGFSVAGKQGGLQDDRSVLCLTFCQLLADMQPRWFVWENVPGVFSTGGGEDFKAFIRKVNEVGYCCGWRVLDAQYTRVDGFPRAIPQRRRRVFVIGHLGDEWQYPAEVLFEPTSMPWNTPPRRIKGKGFAGNAERGVGDASWFYENHAQDCRVKEITDGVCVTIGSSNANSPSISGNNPLIQKCFVKTAKTKFKGDCETYVDTGVAPTVNTFDQGDKRANELICESIAIAENIIGRKVQNGGNDQAVFTTAMSIGNGQPAEASIMMEECCQTLNCMHDQQAVMCLNDQECCLLREPRQCQPDDGKQGGFPVITSRAGTGGGNLPLVQEIGMDGYNSTLTGNVSSTIGVNAVMSTGRNGVVTNATVRRLLPVECERLMGFPDNWTRIPWKGKPEEECPDSPRYKACGNSMCVNVMRWIGMRIEMVERRMKGEEK